MRQVWVAPQEFDSCPYRIVAGQGSFFVPSPDNSHRKGGRARRPATPRRCRNICPGPVSARRDRQNPSWPLRGDAAARRYFKSPCALRRSKIHVPHPAPFLDQGAELCSRPLYVHGIVFEYRAAILRTD